MIGRTERNVLATEVGDVVGMSGNTLRRILLLLALALMVTDLYLALVWAPTERIMGHVQRVMYIHLPLVLVSFTAFFVVLIGSIGYLWKRDSRWDALAYSAAEIGVVAITLVLITGAMWAKPVWGVWWTWEPTLTTALILWLIYIAYLMLRAYAPTPTQAARYSAILGIVGFVDVPIVYMAARLWRGVHPRDIELESSMALVLLFSLLTFTVLYTFLQWQRYRMRRMEDFLMRVRYAMKGL